MSAVRSVRLDLLRSGPAHNQLLSPLTPYIAVCGSAAPVGVHLPFEHQQLLTRLQRLRYGTARDPIANSQREAEIFEMGKAIGAVFRDIPALLTEISHAAQEQTQLVNLRLSITSYELGMVPFETAIGPDGIPGSGSPLQLRSLIAITREIRRGEPLPLHWNRPPRILFAFASPQGLPAVPAQDHLKALRRAIDPWVRIKDDEKGRVEEVKKILTVLPDATLDKIRAACQCADFTHVHLLAHGAPIQQSGVERYGIALSSGSGEARIVDGEQLVIALEGRDSSGRAKQPPSVVSLATCDSGNVGTVLVPGGSIAHELHDKGVPWVIASQFPLWMRASSIAVDVLYTRLLEGYDPRWVLHELRQRLRTEAPETHDWASIVAYASIAPDLEQQVEAFRDRQMRARIEVQFARIDELVGADTPDETDAPALADAAAKEEVKRRCDEIRKAMTAWRAELDDASTAQQRCERIGMRAASEKRIAIAYSLAGEKALSTRAYRLALQYYREAIDADPVNHWVITQYLSIAAIPMLAGDPGKLKALAGEYGSWWTAARQIAQWQERARGKSVWPLATLAELEILGAVYQSDRFDAAKAAAEIERLCRRMREDAKPESFEMCSTLRQLRRYEGYWSRNEWKDLVRGAIAALGAEARATMQGQAERAQSGQA